MSKNQNNQNKSVNDRIDQFLINKFKFITKKNIVIEKVQESSDSFIENLQKNIIKLYYLLISKTKHNNQIYVNIVDIVSINIEIIDLAKLKSVAYVKYFNNLFYEYNKLFRTFQFDQKADIIRFEFQNWKNEIEKLNPNDLLSETQCNKIALDAQKWLSELKELLRGHKI
ncbi:MAG: hypothetical protein VW394_07835 [Candidatus Heimdallarchaeota archaeon]